VGRIECTDAVRAPIRGVKWFNKLGNGEMSRGPQAVADGAFSSFADKEGQFCIGSARKEIIHQQTNITFGGFCFAEVGSGERGPDELNILFVLEVLERPAPQFQLWHGLLSVEVSHDAIAIGTQRDQLSGAGKGFWWKVFEHETFCCHDHAGKQRCCEFGIKNFFVERFDYREDDFARGGRRNVNDINCAKMFVLCTVVNDNEWGCKKKRALILEHVSKLFQGGAAHHNDEIVGIRTRDIDNMFASKLTVVGCDIE